jgi:L-lactate dehydrogenase complex protein LldF
MSQVIKIHPMDDFKERSRSVLNDPGQRKNFRGAMDYLQAKRRSQFPDEDELQGLRELGSQIRRYSLANLPRLLEQLEAKLSANGVQVHWAQNPEEANAIALGIAQRVKAKRIIKGKSMVSEEVGFNHAMEAAGIEALESDMGEYIVQLAGEAPSHIIMPAIHKTRQEIAKLFVEEIPGVAYTEDVDALIRIGRKVLRRKFADADIGLSGVNFCVAETGTLCLVENEGNGRMCTTVPKVHIAITGIEKVVEKLEHVPPLYSLLSRSATGQAVTTYFNLISGPRQPGEKDGPEEVHLILLDNGRTQAYADEELRETLKCIRCGACVEVCPVKIPITDILVRLRNESQAKPESEDATLRGSGAGRTVTGSAVWNVWAQVYGRTGLYKLASWFMSRGRALSPSDQGAWTRSRTPLVPAPKRLRDLLKERK